MNHAPTSDRFAENSRQALLDPQLQEALATATGRFTSARRIALVSVQDEWEALRDRARAVKAHTIAHLDTYLADFSSNVRRLGGHVFYAEDAAEASQYVVDVARARGVSLAVKSKSMMTEEIELNDALIAAGVDPVETDLGEFIIQLAGQRPSHIIAPAIHLTRGQVADLFAAKLHVPRTDDVEKLTALARTLLRDRFASAGMGITGANFAVAETGTIVLVENEGNIRCTTSLPPVHVAVMSLEKVIPRLDDLAVFLRLLPRSASGQNMSAYVSFLTGVKESPRDEGPEELHVVILDNGRTRILADPHLRESLYCIRCGACLNVCPVYQKIGGHAYGWIHTGPIGAVLTPQLLGREQAADLPFASSLCGACREVCPIKINIPDMLLRLRQEIVDGGECAETDAGGSHRPGSRPAATNTDNGHVPLVTHRRWRRRMKSAVEKMIVSSWAAMMKSRGRYEAALRLARFWQTLTSRRGDGPHVPHWSVNRAFPHIPPRTFHRLWQRNEEIKPGTQANGNGNSWPPKK